MAIATGAISTAVAVFEMNRPSIAVMTNKLPTRDVGRLNTAQALGDRFSSSSEASISDIGAAVATADATQVRCALTECGNDVDLFYRERGYS